MGQRLSTSSAEGKREPDLYAEVFESIQNGNLAKLKLYAKEMPDFYEATQDGKSLLHWSIHHAQTDCVDFLLQNGMDVNITDTWGNTPVMELAHCKRQASQTALRSVIALLIKAKADINTTNVHNRTVLLRTIINFRHEVSEILLDLGADTNKADEDGLLPLHVCATYMELPLLRKVIRNKADINARDKLGRTALYLAVQTGPTQIVNELLQCGADMNIGSKFGRPLQNAMIKGKYDCVLAFIEHGACVNFTVSEQRHIYCKAKDCLNLALISLHMQISFLQSAEEFIPSDRLISTVQILDLILQSYGDKVYVFKNIFFKSGKPRFIFSLPDTPLFRRMKTQCRQLQFLHGMSNNLRSLPGEGLPDIETITDCRSLQNLCRIKMRKLLMQTRTNLVYAVKKLDCTLVVKDLLLLKDIL